MTETLHLIDQTTRERYALEVDRVEFLPDGWITYVDIESGHRWAVPAHRVIGLDRGTAPTAAAGLEDARREIMRERLPDGGSGWSRVVAIGPDASPDRH